MRRTRSILMCTALLLALLSLNHHAAAGGGSIFDFSGHWFAPGETVEGSTSFSDWEGAPGRVSDGPYFAYLVPGDRYIDPPRVPADAIRLGRVKMKHVAGTTWSASIRFTVPEVRPGRYTISLCNVPCRSDFAGDLMGAWISIAATAEQARMRRMETRIQERVMQQVWNQTAGLQEQIDALRERSPSTDIGMDLRFTATEDQIERLSAQLRDLAQRADQGIIAWLWMAGWIIAGGLALAWRRTAVLRRRRSVAASDPSPGPPSDGVVWNEVAVYEESVRQLEIPRSSGELVGR